VAVVFALFALVLPYATHAAGNDGAHAWLTWSPTSVVSNLTTPSASNNLYVRIEGAASFKGAEIDLSWTPAGDGATCAAHTATIYATSTDCTYLNRGTAVPVVSADDPGHLHIAWSNTATNTDCAAGGNAVVLQFAYDGCADPSGCITLACVQLVDETNHVTL